MPDPEQVNRPRCSTVVSTPTPAKRISLRRPARGASARARSARRRRPGQASRGEGPAQADAPAQVVQGGADDVDAAVRVVEPVDRHLVDPQPAALGEHEQLGVEEPAGVLHQRQQLARDVRADRLEPALRVGEPGAAACRAAAGCSRGEITSRFGPRTTRDAAVPAGCRSRGRSGRTSAARPAATGRRGRSRGRRPCRPGSARPRPTTPASAPGPRPFCVEVHRRAPRVGPAERRQRHRARSRRCSRCPRS